MTADEAFLTGTMAEVVPVVKIHGVLIAEGKPGPVTKEIIRAFQRIIQDPKEGVPIRETISIPAKARTN
jgi:branched-chain amino acid aminotransferase